MLRERIKIKETNILVICDEKKGIEAVRESVLRNRTELERYIALHPYFMSTLEPVEITCDAPTIVKLMAIAGKAARVGPMAGVAGTIAQLAAQDAIRAGAKNVMVENGGDICIIGDKDWTVGIYAGCSALSKKLALKIKAKSLPLGICTSSGTVGHSLSFGNADSVTVLSKSAPLADAAATAIGNRISTRDKNGINAGIAMAKKIKGVEGVIIIVRDLIGCYGDLPEIIRINELD
jgi:hypothetical protein